MDGNTDFVGTGNTTCLVKGDANSISIAAASILAKVVRDRIMRDLSLRFATYEFESNKGYHSPRHESALRTHGPSGIHRRNTKFMKKLRRASAPDDLWPDPPASALDLAGYALLSPSFGPDGVTRPRPE